MSMLDVAKFLHYSKSIDHPCRDERFLNLSMVNSGHLFSCLQSEKFKRNISVAYDREQVAAERRPLFWKGN